jgi:hypothetical protein
MASKKTIADLHARLTADVSQYDAEMKKAAAIAVQTQSKIGSAFSQIGGALGGGVFARLGGVVGTMGRLGLATTGAVGAVAALAAETVNVARNIEKIPGIPPATVASIQMAKEEFSSMWRSMRNEGQKAIASTLGFLADMGASIKATILNIADGSGDAYIGSRAGIGATATEIARTKDPEAYDAAEASARRRLAQANMAARRSGLTPGQQVQSLNAEAQDYREFGASPNQTSIQSLEAQTKAVELEAQAREKLLGIQRELKTSEDSLYRSLVSNYTATVSNKEAISALQQEAYKYMGQLADLGDVAETDALGLERKIELTKKLTENQKLLGKAYDRANQMAMSVGNTIASSFESAIFQGGKLSDIIKGLTRDLMAMIFRQMVTAPLAGAIAGALGGFFGVPAAGGKASGGSVYGDSLYLVGEQGPEIFAPGTGGNIIPNHAISGMRQGGGGNVFQIDARGASADAVSRLERMVSDLNGSIEFRAVSAVFSAQTRGRMA